MEIPYIVTPRKDTGLFNSKIAIWLFLASEVMLFGGFFSAYVFLRIGADYPWPERTLPVVPGLINTFVLIGSSVTVVFAWAALKLRQWRRFQIFMGITCLCAVVFMVLKGIEYKVKWGHQAVRLMDYAVVEGHLDYEKDKDGHKIEKNLIRFETTDISFNTVRTYQPWVEGILARAAEANAAIRLADELRLKGKVGGQETVIPAGTELSQALLDQIRGLHLAARANNSAVRTGNLKEKWKEAKAANPGKRGWEFADNVVVDSNEIASQLLPEQASVTFKVEPPVVFEFKPRDVREGASESTLRDGTVVRGKLLESPMVFHDVDAIDFRHTAMKAEEKGIDPAVAIENSWLLKENPQIREAWEWHKDQVAKLEKRLTDKYGLDRNGAPKRVPTETERYRIGWKDFVAKSAGVDRGVAKATFKEEFFGPDYDARRPAKTFPHLDVPREQVQFASKFAPAWNTYYAIYFTMTGLHGIHVIGGALVLAYYLFFGKSMYLTNPEWLANRVEVGGLFWHFVDLVWIFLFPILYLM